MCGGVEGWVRWGYGGLGRGLKGMGRKGMGEEGEEGRKGSDWVGED